MVVVDLFKAVKAGKQLKDSKTWSNTQALSSVFVAIVAFGVGAARLLGMDIPITDEQIIVFSGGLAGVAWSINAIISVATHKDAGV